VSPQDAILDEVRVLIVRYAGSPALSAMASDWEVFFRRLYAVAQTLEPGERKALLLDVMRATGDLGRQVAARLTAHDRDPSSITSADFDAAWARTALDYDRESNEQMREASDIAERIVNKVARTDGNN
jgi:hypothetical protein